MKFTFKNTAILVASMAMIASPALAHNGNGFEHGFVHGFEHFFSGADHLAYSILGGIMTGLATKKLWSRFASLIAFAIVFAMSHDLQFYGNGQVSTFVLGIIFGETIILSLCMFATDFVGNIRKQAIGGGNGRN